LWCTLALLPPLKLKAQLAISTLLRVSLGTTMLGLVPPCAMLLVRPSRVGFILCATSCALAFFLCSFQVHEKHILLPLLPASLLAPRHPALFGWFASVASFSLYPLLKRDGQSLPYFVGQAAYFALSLHLEALVVQQRPVPSASLAQLIRIAMGTSLLGMLTLHLLEATVLPPSRYPDLHTVVFAAYSCLHFVVAYVATVIYQARIASTENAHTPQDKAAPETHQSLAFLFNRTSSIKEE